MGERVTKYEQKYTVAIFDNFAKGENREMRWPTLAKSLTMFEEYETKGASRRRRAIIGGPLIRDNASREDNVNRRSLLTMDFDAVEGSMDDVEFLFDFDAPFDLAVHTTFRHTPETPRVRVIVPLSREVNAEEHTIIVDWAAKELGPDVLGRPDPCSYVMAQLMFLPSRKVGGPSWATICDTYDEPLDVEKVLDIMGYDPSQQVDGSGSGSDDGPGDDDLSLALAHRPLDLTEAQIDRLLDVYTAEGCEYQEWAEVGMGLWHQFQGSWDGFVLWDHWSGKDEARYPGRHDLERKWKTFDVGDRGRKPLTLATIIARAGGGDVLKVDIDTAVEVEVDGEAVALSLMDQAKGVCSLETYDAFKRRVRGLTSGELPVDRRQMLAKVVSDAWAKGAGVTITEVRKALTPKRAVTAVEGGEADADGEGRVVERVQWDCPSWLDDWVYVDGKDAGYFTQPLSEGRETLVKEGFNARYNRLVPLDAEGEPVAPTAAVFALDMVQIDTVYSEMYWPGNDAVFWEKNVKYANSFRDGSVLPREGDGGVAQAFFDHLEKIVEDERERELLLDWMKFVYEEGPRGGRVNWAPLIYGTHGNGKSYLAAVMTALLGRHNARDVSAKALMGRFTSWGEGSLFNAIEEIRVDGRDKWAIMDKIKPYITNPKVEIESKGRDVKDVPNFTSYMMFSNHADALPIAKSERRYMVVATRQVVEGDLARDFGDVAAREVYFERLYSGLWADGGDGAAQIAAALVDRPYSEYGFKATGEAPRTEARSNMISFHVSEGDDALEDAMDVYRDGWINEALIDLTRLQAAVALGEDEAIREAFPQTRALSHKLVELGYTRIDERVRVGGNGGRKHTAWYNKALIGEPLARKAVQRGGVELSDDGKWRLA